ncbi:MAG: TlpA family protein disulfide reductase [Gemmatimonadetes bacterium]|nr:TlpA family protein disulfide reductase [Gemmatimonadota bacterium]
MSRQWAVVGGVVLVLVALVSAGWFARERFLPVEVGTRAPNVVAHDLQGQPVALEDLVGQVVLLNVWATWCPPCREEMPSMQRLHERFASDGLRVVAVSIDAAPGTASPGSPPGGDVGAFVQQHALSFDVWLDPAGSIQRTYRTTGVPESFVIDRDGSIVKKVIGATDWDSEANRDLVRMLLEN